MRRPNRCLLFRSRFSAVRRTATHLLVEPMEERLLLSTFTVLNTLDSGANSLRQAILDANAAPNVGAPDQIAFAIPGTGVHTIAPLTALPAITDPVVLDGYSQPGSSPNTLDVGDNAVLTIELNGASQGGDANGLTIAAGGSTVRGLVINRVGTGSAAGGMGIGLTTKGGDVIAGNFLGTDPTGTLAEGNTFGVEVVSGSGNTIGGTSAAARNIVSGNVGDGIGLYNGAAPLTAIQGNYVGTTASGEAALGNGSWGIELEPNSATVGGTDLGVRNVISGNGKDGILAGSSGLIQGNYIGIDAAGTTKLGNQGAGVRVFGSNNTIGGEIGSTSRPRNVIGGNAGDGIVIADNGPGSSGNLVEGNDIGTTGASVSSPNLGNGGNGVLIESGGESSGGGNNSIGGSSQASNVIAFNGRNGVAIDSSNGAPAPTGNAVQGNRIFSNAGLGIDLGSDGVTPNTPGGPHAGPNHLQNFPVITSVVFGAEIVTVGGTLNSIPNTTFQLEFFGNAAADPSGFGQGQIPLGTQSVTTDAAGNAPFSAELGAQGDIGSFFTATATDPSGNTSEFSRAFQPSSAATADLAISVASVPAAVTVGQDVTFTLTASNNGPTSPATSVVVNDRIPAGAAIVSVVPAGFVNYHGQLIFNLGNLARGAPVTITIMVQPALGTAINTAQIASLDQADPVAANNAVTSTTQVNPALAPVLVISGQPTSSHVTASPANTLTYAFTITNTGNAPATDVSLAATLPNTVRFLRGDHGATVTGGVLTVSIGSVAAGATITASVTVAPLSAGSANLDARVTSGNAPAALVHIAASIDAAPVVPSPTPVTDPTVTRLVRTGVHMHPTTLILTFSGPMNTAAAEDVRNYHVVAAGRDGKVGTNAETIGVLSAVYDAATRSVTLRPARRLNVHHRFQLTVGGTSPRGLRDLAGRFLDGAHVGHPSGDATILFGWSNLQPSPQTPARHTARELSRRRR